MSGAERFKTSCLHSAKSAGVWWGKVVSFDSITHDAGMEEGCRSSSELFEAFNYINKGLSSYLMVK